MSHFDTKKTPRTIFDRNLSPLAPELYFFIDTSISKVTLQNSSSIYNVPTIATAVQVRYSASGENKCPMNTDSLEDHPDCKLAASQEEVDALDKSLRQRSQLFFPNIKYAQRGKYICMATQEFKLPGKESVEKPVSSFLVLFI